jgi:hypothetical protein
MGPRPSPLDMRSLMARRDGRTRCGPRCRPGKAPRANVTCTSRSPARGRRFTPQLRPAPARAVVEPLLSLCHVAMAQRRESSQGAAETGLSGSRATDSRSRGYTSGRSPPHAKQTAGRRLRRWAFPKAAFCALHRNGEFAECGPNICRGLGPR